MKLSRPNTTEYIAINTTAYGKVVCYQLTCLRSVGCIFGGQIVNHLAYADDLFAVSSSASVRGSMQCLMVLSAQGDIVWIFRVWPNANKLCGV